MKSYRRCIVFTKRPLKEAYVYRDRFIVQPITRSNIPHSPYAKHFPAFLDFTVESEDGRGIIEKDIDETRKICAILTALSNFEFFTYNTDKVAWGVVAPSVDISSMTEEEIAKMNEEARSSVWLCVAGFMYPDYAQDRIISSLSVLDGNSIMQCDNNPSYFTDNPIQEEKDKVLFHEKMGNALDTFYSLDEDTRKIVYSAILLIADGIKLGLHYQSLGFLSYVSSIETMVDLENKGIKIHHCQKCGQPIYSVKKKFLDYLGKYVSNTEASRKKFSDYYSLRSRIAHAGNLFISDVEFSLLNKEIDNKEWFKYMEVQQLARLSLYQWLLRSFVCKANEID